MPFQTPTRSFAIPAGMRIRSLAVATAIGIALAACGSGSDTADMVLLNGYVYTVDGQDRVAQAVAVRDGRIVYVGDDAGARRLVDEKRTQVVDLGGRMLMPGLVDGHIHALKGGAATLQCSLDYLPLTVAQMKDRIQACLKSDGATDKWLQVVNWDRQAMSTRDRDPTRLDLDSLSSTRPIFIVSIDGHTALVNSRALELAGITQQTANPPGGSITRDAQGKATGILEDSAVLMARDAVPAPTDEERVQHAAIALDMLRRQGVTSFMGVRTTEAEIKAFSTLSERNQLSARALFAPEIAVAQADQAVAAVADVRALAQRYSRSTTEPSPTVQVRHVKLFLDGVLQTPAETGALLAPYRVNSGSASAPQWTPGTATGQQYFSQGQLDAVVTEAVRAGFEPHLHAIGDAAVRRALDSIEYAHKQLPNSNFRSAVAHAELVDPADYPRFKALDTLPVMSFQWAQQAPYSVEAVKDQLGPERYARMEPEGSLVQAGARLAYGSDWPVDPMAYFYNLSVGVMRRGTPSHPASFGPNYAGRLNEDPLLPRSTALRAITMNSAYQLGLERQLGSIEQGKWADLIVLDRNFMQVAEGDLASTQVLLTVVGGKPVWADGPYVSQLGTKTLGTNAVLPRTFNVKASTGHAVIHGGDGHAH